MTRRRSHSPRSHSEGPSDPVTTQKHARGRRTAVHGLVALNALLLGALAFVTLSPDAGAQVRRNGLYTIVGGTANGTVAGVAYIIDEINQEMVAISWNEGSRSLSGLGYANLGTDAQRATQGVRP